MPARVKILRRFEQRLPGTTRGFVYEPTPAGDPGLIIDLQIAKHLEALRVVQILEVIQPKPEPDKKSEDPLKVPPAVDLPPAPPSEPILDKALNEAKTLSKGGGSRRKSK